MTTRTLCLELDCDAIAECDECGFCRDHCVCFEDDYDADELGLDPEEKYDA